MRELLPRSLRRGRCRASRLRYGFWICDSSCVSTMSFRTNVSAAPQTLVMR
ncbi:MAG: hypothetical protein OXU61_02755 [Gammaproteobacteria bacterium]|nr:hypothetical protein [Gammaproteobacteria bacterium]